MTDENQNPQNQGNPQVQDQNTATSGDDFDLFGGDDDIFENPDLLKGVDEVTEDDGAMDNTDDSDILVEPSAPVQAPSEPEIVEPEDIEPEIVEPDDMDDDIGVDYREINNEDDTISSGASDSESKDIDSSSQAPQNDIDVLEGQNEEPEEDNFDDDFEDFDPIPEVDDGLESEDEINNESEDDTAPSEEDNMSSGASDSESKDIDSSAMPQNDMNDSEGQNDDEGDIEDDYSPDIEYDEPDEDTDIIEDEPEQVENEPEGEPIQDSPAEDTQGDESQDFDIYQPDSSRSVLQNKFYELKFETEKIFNLVNKDFSKGFDLLGGNDDARKITYKIFVYKEEDGISIEKSEFDKANETTQTHNLSFDIQENSLGVYVDNEFLYDEVDDLQNDKNKAMQVMDKLNKFIFLVTDEYKKIERDKKLKERNNQLKGTFRNF